MSDQEQSGYNLMISNMFGIKEAIVYFFEVSYVVNEGGILVSFHKRWVNWGHFVD